MKCILAQDAADGAFIEPPQILQAEYVINFV